MHSLFDGKILIVALTCFASYFVFLLILFDHARPFVTLVAPEALTVTFGEILIVILTLCGEAMSWSADLGLLSWNSRHIL